MATVSVIVTARRGVQLAAGCLPAIYAQAGPAVVCEVFLVGHVSAEAPLPAGSAAGAPLLHLIPHVNTAAARNLALARAQGELIAFTDADCTPAPDWLAQLTAPLAEAPAVVGVKGSYATQQTNLIARYAQLEYEEKYDRLQSRTWIDFIDLYAAVYRREVLQANNGFDERFPFLEDRELAFRLAARGYQLRFARLAVVYHPHAANLRTYALSKFHTGYWNAQVSWRFPGQVVSDAHTPQRLKVQMALIGLLPLAVALSAFLPWGDWLWLTLAALYLASILPFVARAWGWGASKKLALQPHVAQDSFLPPHHTPVRRDWAVALAAPGLLSLRAIMLLAGATWGIIRPQPGIANAQTTIGGWNYVTKRGMDIVGGLIGVALLFLLTPLIGLAIKLESTGPIFFKQERIGQRGRPFIIYKFRSMTADAEARLPQLVDLDQLEQPVFKLQHDPRVTRVGRWLRRTSLDELPQFWNVLKGDMSLVGPRPEESRLVARYNDWQRRRLAVKPGLSGPMQVHGRGNLSLDERVQLEVAYIENYSLWRDLVILWRTLPAVIGGDGAR